MQNHVSLTLYIFVDKVSLIVIKKSPENIVYLFSLKIYTEINAIPNNPAKILRSRRFVWVSWLCLHRRENPKKEDELASFYILKAAFKRYFGDFLTILLLVLHFISQLLVWGTKGCDSLESFWRNIDLGLVLVLSILKLSLFLFSVLDSSAPLKWLK